MQAEVQFSDTSLKPKKIKNLPPLIQRLHNFWINSIEPWWTYFLTTWRVNMRARFKADFKIMQEQFLAKADRAFQDYKLGDAGSAGTKFANYRKLMYEFLEYPSRAKMKIPNSAKNVYKQLWDDFVSYGEKMYAGNPEQLRDFRNFCDEFKRTDFGDGSFNFKTPNVDEIINPTAPQKFRQGANNEVKEIVDELQTGLQGLGKNLKNNAKDFIKEWLGRYILHFFTGFYTTPKEFLMKAAKEDSILKKLTVEKGEFKVTKSFSPRRLNYEYLRLLFIQRILVPAVISLIGALIVSKTGLIMSSHPWATSENEIYNLVVGYVLYDLLYGTDIDLPRFVEKFLPKSHESWRPIIGKILPGKFDDLMILLLMTRFGSIKNDKTTGEKIDETQEQIQELFDFVEFTKQTTSTDQSKEFKQHLVFESTSGDISISQAQLLLDRFWWDESNLVIYDLFEKDKKYYIKKNPKWSPSYLNNEPLWVWDDGGKNKTIKELADKLSNEFRDKLKKFCEKYKKNEKTFKKFKCDQVESSNDVIFEKTGVVSQISTLGNVKENKLKKYKNLIVENTPRTKFGEDNFKHWKDTFIFKAEDEKNPGQFKQVKINMEDVMDRINHYRKKYDEDDAFVRAVLDTHDNVVKVMYTKDLADINESASPRGLALVLREDKGELEIFSVSRPANGNWFLVKGDYTPSQLANMDLEKKEPEDKEPTKISKTEDDLKKKEEESIILLKRNEKEGLIDLPRKVKQKLKEKMSNGWTTEEPPSYLMDFYTTSQVNSVFNDPIEIYKLESSPSYFATLVKYSARVIPKRGFCRSLYMVSKNEELNERQRKTVNHILTKCRTKLSGKFGIVNT